MAAGPFLSYGTLNYMLLPLPFVALAACWGLPETPHYLLKEGRVGSAREALARLRGFKDQTHLQRAVLGEAVQTSHPGRSRGGVIIKQYLGVIMAEARVKLHERTVFLVFGGISFIVSIVSSILVDRVARRHLLVGSYLGSALALAAVGLYFFLLNVLTVDHAALAVFGAVPFIAIVLSNVISTFGFIALSGVIPAEIFPLNVKAVAMTSLSIFGGVLGFTVGKAYQHVKDLLGQHTVFWIFAAVAFFGAVFTLFVVPETRGKDLNEIQKEMQGDAYHENSDRLKKIYLNIEGTELDELKRKESI
ncbi:Sugar transporter [Operophtera brumata]|uniref:Sugar transporter n=1 Tax=Operophtera brumata TaxID=104452 RepID=A0A0L7LKT1_OPEBR|nr:Sugar transporter [Operophtera brumata]